IFNQGACAGCHPGDGRGPVETALTRFSIGGDPVLPLGGPQLQDAAIPGVAPETLPAGVEVSRRLPPPVFGVGLIENIPVATILSREDVNDDDADGISGRAHWVTPADFVPAHEIGGGPGPQLGRFSRKAQVSSLIQQVTEAYHQDMGITSDFLPVENPNPQAGGFAAGDVVADPEIPASIVLETVVYVRLLAPPETAVSTPLIEEGRALFNQIGCADCHTPVMQTAAGPIPALSEVDVHLYSDLLLHDMGPDLADGRTDGDASGSEWRTAPLWGMRIAGDFLAGEVPLLHDGRTTDLHEAIVFHGGEAAASRDGYLALTSEQEAAVREFVRTR
ncbi:MAG: thiol oxidoreductase, partial [Gemmatimonadetes bacterium]|nr:thiol oxidoreductase [Gemmatimonadota bacterium]